MLSDGIVDLIEMGVVTNEFKATDTGRTIGGFAFGSSRLYKFIEMNPAIELRNIEYGARAGSTSCSCKNMNRFIN
jgi:acyl-CoA hydrolase